MENGIYFQASDGSMQRIGDVGTIVIDNICRDIEAIGEAFALFSQTIEVTVEASRGLSALFAQYANRLHLRRQAIAKARGKNWRNVR